VRKKTTEEFILDAMKVHGDRYDYSLVEYEGVDKKVIITCPEHGPFEQTPHNHLSGSICPKCSNIKSSLRQRKDLQSFIDKAKSIHGDKYDYSLVEYKNAHTKVTIICPEHGPFEQTPNCHTRLNRKNGCSVCSQKKRHDIESFITKANKIHNNKYDYSQVVYRNNKTHVTIICPEHGPFEQRPDHHFRGQGCVKCLDRNSSIQEKGFVEFVSEVYNKSIITNTKDIISPYEIDCYLPDKNIAFEYNGTYWHKEGVNVPIGYHQMKTDMCKDKGITLYHIWEDDWVGNNNQVREQVRDILGL
jgi:hypothetical protein